MANTYSDDYGWHQDTISIMFRMCADEESDPKAVTESLEQFKESWEQALSYGGDWSSALERCLKHYSNRMWESLFHDYKLAAEDYYPDPLAWGKNSEDDWLLMPIVPNVESEDCEERKFYYEVSTNKLFKIEEDGRCGECVGTLREC